VLVGVVLAAVHHAEVRVHVAKVPKVPLSKLLILAGNLFFSPAGMADLHGLKVLDLFGQIMSTVNRQRRVVILNIEPIS
jgi:hypothetical protein